MKTILIASELGGGLGHVMRAAAYAREFSRQGARVIVALSDLVGCQHAQWPENVCLLQSPLHSRAVTGFFDHANFGEILYCCGYHDVNQLSALVAGWRNLMTLVDADAVIADHAPTAQLAARVNDIDLVRVGTGFFAPPPVSPTPRFRTWQDISVGRMLEVEARVLQIINTVMVAHGGTPSATLSAALTPDLEMISSWLELDCYASLRPVGSVIYLGNERTGAQGIVPVWPGTATSAKRKIAVYLSGDFSAIETVLGELQQGYSTVAYVAGYNEKMRRVFSTKDLWFASGPLDLPAAARDCDAVVCHAGAGTAPLFLESGKPVLLLPSQAEQRINADMIAQTGAGLRLEESALKDSFSRGLTQLLEDPSYAGAAQRIAGRWSNQEDAVVTGASKVMQWLGGA